MLVLVPPSETSLRQIVTMQPAEVRAMMQSHYGWSRVKFQLINWVNDPAQVENEDGEIPSLMTLRKTQSVAVSLEQAGWTPPIGVAPDGAGGFTINWDLGPISRWVEISANGDVEIVTIRQGTLIQRERLQISQN